MPIHPIFSLGAVLFGLSASVSAIPARAPENTPSPLAEGVTYPKPVEGRWEPGPSVCRLPLTYDSDAGFTIAPTLLQGYEHTSVPKRIESISMKPRAWRIEAVKSFDDDEIAVTEIFVVSHDGDYLTVTDGTRSKLYSKCH